MGMRIYSPRERQIASGINDFTGTGYRIDDPSIPDGDIHDITMDPLERINDKRIFNK